MRPRVWLVAGIAVAACGSAGTASTTPSATPSTTSAVSVPTATGTAVGDLPSCAIRTHDSKNADDVSIGVVTGVNALATCQKYLKPTTDVLIPLDQVPTTTPVCRVHVRADNVDITVYGSGATARLVCAFYAGG